MIRSALVLLIILVGYWLSLSGYFDKPVVLTMGAISIVVVILLCARMKILDGETVPYAHGKSLVYLVWLSKEIVKANMTVIKAVMKPDLQVTPTLTKVKNRNLSGLGTTVFANSITLTPGTISMDIGDEEILVHALLKEMSDPADFVEMEKRAAWSVNDPGQNRMRESEA